MTTAGELKANLEQACAEAALRHPGIEFRFRFGDDRGTISGLAAINGERRHGVKFGVLTGEDPDFLRRECDRLAEKVI